MRTVVDAIIIDPDEGVLLTRKKDTWIFPGGKIDDGETDLETLDREIGEELQGAKIDKTTVVPYKSFVGETPFTHKQIQVKTYFAQLIAGTILPSGEIEEAKYIKDFLSIQLSSITKEILSTLIVDGYIK